MKLGCLTLVVAALVGCATTAGYKQMCDSWNGGKRDALIQAWGPPHRSATLSDGMELLTWDRQSKGGYYDAVNKRDVDIDRRCETTFTVNTLGTIVAYSFRGNACTAQAH
jgi:hypothetical protein